MKVKCLEETKSNCNVMPKIPHYVLIVVQILKTILAYSNPSVTM